MKKPHSDIVSPEYFDAIIPHIIEMRHESNGFLRLILRLKGTELSLDWKKHNKGQFIIVGGQLEYNFEFKVDVSTYSIIITDLQLAEYIWNKRQKQKFSIKEYENGQRDYTTGEGVAVALESISDRKRLAAPDQERTGQPSKEESEGYNNPVE